MFDFTLSLQPVIQFMTLPPPPGFEELVSTFADEVGNAFDRTATRVRAIVHSVQFQTFGNLSDYSHIQIASFVSNSFVNIVGFSPSEGEAVAAQTEESRVTIPSGFDPGEE